MRNYVITKLEQTNQWMLVISVIRNLIIDKNLENEIMFMTSMGRTNYF
jgi:hypothetical protein